jgi:hypothetical protein
MSNPLNELVGDALESELLRRLSDVALRIARLTDDEAKGSWKATIDLGYEYRRKEQIEDMLLHASKTRGGKRNEL